MYNIGVVKILKNKCHEALATYDKLPVLACQPCQIVKGSPELSSGSSGQWLTLE